MNKKQTFGFSTFELLLVFVIACILGTIVFSKSSEVRQNSRNEQRKGDLVALQTSVDTYKATNSKYPSLADINSPEFRKNNLKTLNNNYIKDPKWAKDNQACLDNGQPILQNSTKPNFGCYGYAVSPVNCDNKTIDCTSYSITATLEPNTIYYTKVSSD